MTVDAGLLRLMKRLKLGPLAPTLPERLAGAQGRPHEARHLESGARDSHPSRGRPASDFRSREWTWLMMGTKPSFTRRAASLGSVTPS